jgi:hypothetical protein
VRQSAYFYRYDLAEGGQYLFNEDGSPRLQPATIPAEIDQAAGNNRVQRVSLADGLDRVNLFYGYDESLPQSGRTKSNSVEISAGMTAADVEAAIEETLLRGKIDVAVEGSGTQADPWVVTFPDDGPYRQLAHHYDVQTHVGRLTRREDTRVYQRFYRLTDPKAEYLFHGDGGSEPGAIGRYRRRRGSGWQYGGCALGGRAACCDDR